MLFWTLAALLTAFTATFLLLKARRRPIYTAMKRMPAAGGLAPAFNLPASFDFTRRLFTKGSVLANEQLRALVAEAQRIVQTERSYLPTHKKGGTVAYETLCAEAPVIVALYRSEAMRELVSRIVGAPVVVTPVHDQSSCSILFYERPGDHIDWHYDHNFYRGSHFTVLLVLENHGHGQDGLSAARLLVKDTDGERVVPTPPNTLVVFEGAKVLHKVTPIAEGERRVMLSMTFCTDPTSSVVQGAARRIKDTAFFGLRALWT